MQDTFLHVARGIHSVEVPHKATITLSSTYRPRAELKAGEKQDLSHQNSKGQIGMDMIALVADGADRSGRR